MKIKDIVTIREIRNKYLSVTNVYGDAIVKLIDALNAREKEKRKHDLIAINENVNSSEVFDDVVTICEAFGYDYVTSRLMNENILVTVIYEIDYLRQPPRLYENLERKTIR